MCTSSLHSTTTLLSYGLAASLLLPGCYGPDDSSEESVDDRAAALVGPDAPLTNAADGTFSLLVQEDRNLADPNIDIFYEFKMQERARGRDGWDWGGRSGYSCGFFELVDGGATNSLSDD